MANIIFSPGSTLYDYNPNIGANLNDWLTEELDSNEKNSASYAVNQGNLSPFENSAYLAKDLIENILIDKCNYVLIGHIKIKKRNPVKELSTTICIGLEGSAARRLTKNDLLVATYFSKPEYLSKITPDDIKFDSKLRDDKWLPANFDKKNGISITQLINDLKPKNFDTTLTTNPKGINPSSGKVFMANSFLFTKEIVEHLVHLPKCKYIGFSPVVFKHRHQSESNHFNRTTGLVYAMDEQNKVLLPKDKKFYVSDDPWPRTYPQWIT